MKEMRTDSITGDVIIFSSYRNKRPRDNRPTDNGMGKNIENKILNEYEKSCPFCLGNEKMDDETTEVINEEGGWECRCVKNKFPILDMDRDSIYGQHEVVIESNRHNASYYNMNQKEFENTFEILKRRFVELSSAEGIEYVNIFKNSGRDSGASLNHTHSQIISMNLIPPEIIKELEVSKNFFENSGRHLYENIVETELLFKKRMVFNGEFFIAFIPYATRYNGEIRVVEKNPGKIESWSDGHIKEIAYIYKNLFRRWRDYYEDEIAFNNVLHTYPVNFEDEESFRTHFHIIPRKYNFGGFELSTNLFVCGTDPEELANFMRFE